jgi:LemA protein
MKKWISLIIVGIVIFAAYSWAKGFNNTAVEKEESAKTLWSNVESSYQRRNDLIGNLVSTVKNAAEFEKSTLTAVIEARAKATSTNIDASKLTAANMASFQQAQGGLTSALSKMMLVVERYPELKANQNFLQLQNQLEGTENRINVARNRYNEGVSSYNILIKKFPGSLLAGVFNFDEMTRFKADVNASKAVDVGEKFKN